MYLKDSEAQTYCSAMLSFRRSPKIRSTGFGALEKEHVVGVWLFETSIKSHRGSITPIHIAELLVAQFDTQVSFPRDMVFCDDAF
jgi:hypothetical protein